MVSDQPQWTLPRGLIIELVTPLDQAGAIHWPSLAALIKHVSPWADGLMVAGPDVGGGLDLKTEDRVQLVDFVSQHCDQPLLTFISASSPEIVDDLFEKLVGLPASRRLFYVDSPLLYRSNRGLPDWLGWLSESADRPVLLYNYPNLMGRPDRSHRRRNIRTAVLKKTADNIPGLSGLIFRGDPKRLLNYKQAVRSRNDFKLYEGSETRFLDAPSVSGVVSVGANLLPAAWNVATGSGLYIQEPTTGSLDLLTAHKAVRILAARRRSHLKGWMTAGLTMCGIFDETVQLPPVCPDLGRVHQLLSKLGTERWDLTVKA